MVSKQSPPKILLVESRSAQLRICLLNSKCKIEHGFICEFSFTCTPSKLEDAADGFAFIVHNSKAGIRASGDPGGGMGYSGIDNSLVVEFDMYHNGNINDPNDNHISIQTNGTSPNSSSHHEASIGIEADLPCLKLGMKSIPVAKKREELKIGQEMFVRITYIPVAKKREELLKRCIEILVPDSKGEQQALAHVVVELKDTLFASYFKILEAFIPPNKMISFLKKKNKLESNCYFLLSHLFQSLTELFFIIIYINLGSNHEAWIGFTGATGYFHQLEVINSWKLYLL